MLLVYLFMYLGHIVGLTNPKLQILPYVEPVVWSEALPDTTTNTMAVNIPN